LVGVGRPAIPSLPQWALGIAVGLFVFCVTITMRTWVLTTQDLYLHISVGQWILTHASVPDHAIFSASMPDAPWVAHEWLSEVAFALLYDHFGWGGVLACTALLAGLAIGLLAGNICRTLGPFGAVCCAILGWGLCVHHLTARPHVATLPLLVIWIASHVRARHENAVPPLYLAPLMTLWANLHGGFMFGLVFTGLFAAEAVFESDTIERARGAAIRWSIFWGACVLAAAITPLGIRGLLFPFQMLETAAVTPGMFEWVPSSLENNAPLLLWCFLLLFVALQTGFRLPLCRLLMLMLLLYLAFAHRRHTELLGLTAPLLLQYAVADALSPQARSLATHWGALARPGIDLSVIVASLLVASIVGFVGCNRLVHGPDRFTPAAALDAVIAHGIPGPVLNEQNFGGYFIFRGVMPFIDGRVDMYGGEFMTRYLDVNQLTSLLSQYHIGWTIFYPSNPRIAVMDNLPGWTRFYSDEMAVVHVHQAAPSN
jgi:hypothetical protein